MSGMTEYQKLLEEFETLRAKSDGSPQTEAELDDRAFELHEMEVSALEQ